jgi:phosphoglycerate dehydrogenase-like enzyme
MKTERETLPDLLARSDYVSVHTPLSKETRRLIGPAELAQMHDPPDPNHPLLKLDKVVASMHAAWYSQFADDIRRQAHAGTAADVLEGTVPHTAVNPAVLEPTHLTPRASSDAPSTSR